MSSAEELAARVGEAMWARDSASQALGMTLEEVRPGYARVRMTVRSDMLNGHGTCHGGLVFALADSAFAFACNSRDVVTVAAGCSIEFLAPSARRGRARRRRAGAVPRGPQRRLRRRRHARRRRGRRHVPGPVGRDSRDGARRRGSLSPRRPKSAGNFRRTRRFAVPVLEVPAWIRGRSLRRSCSARSSSSSGGRRPSCPRALTSSPSSSWPPSPSAWPSWRACTPSARSREATSTPPSRWRCSWTSACPATS